MNTRTLSAITAGAFLALGTLAAYLAATGDMDSPLMGLLFLPALLGALAFGFAGGVVTGALTGAIFLLMDVWRARASGLPSREALLWATVLLLVSVAVGAFAEEMRRRAGDAAARARAEHERAAEQEARATETESFLDTAVMMESMYDLSTTLNVALIRLAELIPYTTCAVFLRDPDAPYLAPARLAGLSPERVPADMVPFEEAEARWGNADGRAYQWSDIPGAAAAAGLGPLTALDPEARSVIITPLRTLEDFLGVIFIGAYPSGALTETHRRLAEEFAQYIVYPIHRMRLRALATTDEMTRLDNYRSFRLRLTDETRRASRYGHTLSLILIDVDDFKRINDVYLHVAGDAILRQMGGLLRGILRGTDVAARYGGEEMAILCPETGAGDARTLAERIRATVERHRFLLPDGSADSEVGITVSMGVATLPTHAASDTALVEQADRALYAAKEAGKNQVRAAGEMSRDGAGTPKAEPSMFLPLRP